MAELSFGLLMGMVPFMVADAVFAEFIVALKVVDKISFIRTLRCY